MGAAVTGQKKGEKRGRRKTHFSGSKQMKLKRAGEEKARQLSNSGKNYARNDTDIGGGNLKTGEQCSSVAIERKGLQEPQQHGGGKGES